MGLLFVTGLSLYGIGSLRLGAMVPVLGFPVYTSAMVLSANAAGFLTGEWRGSPRCAYIYELLGIGCQIGSIVVIRRRQWQNCLKTVEEDVFHGCNRESGD